MFIGHFAAGMIGKRLAPNVGLGTHLVACQWLDFLWPVFLFTGVERAHVDHSATPVMPVALDYMPWSHSLVMSAVWSLGFFAVLKLAKKTTREAAVVGAVVFSHFVLDVISHRPDMPLWFGAGSPRLGLGLWYSPLATLVVEGSFFALSVALYARHTKASDRIGTWGLWSFVAFLVAVYAANHLAPKPPEDLPIAGLAIPAIAMLLFVVWGFWADRHRTLRASPAPR